MAANDTPNSDIIAVMINTLFIKYKISHVIMSFLQI